MKWKKRRKELEGVTLFWIFPQDLKIRKGSSDLWRQEVFQRKKKKKTHPKIEYTEYMYPLTLKKAKQSFMSYAENKGELKFCVSAIVKKIAFFFEWLLQLTFFWEWMWTWITTILSPKTTPFEKPDVIFKNNISVTSAYLQSQEI